MANRSFYFAFGSNMDQAQMVRRCPSARFIATAKLRDHQLAFVGWSEGWQGAVATVLPRKRSCAYGVVWDVSTSELALLDAYEGVHGNVYFRKATVVLLADGTTAIAWVYVKTDTREGAPSPAYHGQIREAYVSNGLPTRALDKVPTTDDIKHVFVYGSLLRGLHNHGVIASSRFVRRTATKACYTMHDLGAYPAVVHGGNTSIVGELYRVTDETLVGLDRLEGHPRFYTRCVTRVRSGEYAWIYLLAEDQVVGVPRVPGGDWARFAKGSK